MRRSCLFLAVVLLLSPAADAGENRLFHDAAAEPLNIELVGPFSSIVRDGEPEPESYPGTLNLLDTGEQLAVTLKPRGKSRRQRENCRFPPLWIEMSKADEKRSVFAGHHRRKLVTHCGALRRRQDSSKIWIEMLAYRALNLLTERSFRVQPLNIVYRDVSAPEQEHAHVGFLIEHKKELARRLALNEMDGRNLRLRELDVDHASLMTLFNLLIGNPDFSLLRGPPDDDCCHNSVPLIDEAGAVFPIIYDFDNTGLVDPPYASPPEVLKIRSVRTRVYRGYCRHNDAVAGAAAKLKAVRTEIETLFAEHPEISRSEKERVARYLRQFFERYLSSGGQLKFMLSKCLG